ncbi:MAG: glycosyltransferase family 92 protein [Synergistaceae bacterium]|nr:glycosyltransferase family 92 protein [Synergistaceae bacterium]
MKYLLRWIKSHKSIRLLVKALRYSGESSPLVYRCRDYISNRLIRTILRIFVTPYCLLKYFIVGNEPEREGLAFVLTAKNEAPYIKEWLDFHIKQGVSHFIIYDNESTDNLREVLEPYVKAGTVTYRELKGKNRQVDAYNMAVFEYKHKFRYMAFIDADEFVFVRSSVGGASGSLYSFVDDFMTSHKNAGGIGINWLVFGSNGHITKPEGGVLENFTRCATRNFDPNHLIKTICDPMKVFFLYDPHHAVFRKGYQTLDENGEIITGSVTSEVHYEKVRINHYFTKSKEEFISKRNRGIAFETWFMSPMIRPMSDFDSHDRNEFIDTDILSRR